MPGEPTPAVNEIARVDLLRWIWPQCDHGHVALQYPNSNGETRTGWLHDEADVERAIKAFAAMTLHNERFETATQSGVGYAITGAVRLGLVLHHSELVKIISLDLDDHTDDGGNLHLLKPIGRFLGASPVVFTSKSGKGVHAFFELSEAMSVHDFIAWAKAWGFNRDTQPEMFPKTAKLTQVWMPGEPNVLGGDTYQSGSFTSAVIESLPEPPPAKLTNKTLGFLRGEATQPGRNDALNVVAMELAQKGVDRATACRLCQRGALLCGLDPGETKLTFDSGYNAGCLKPLHAESSPAFTQPHQSLHPPSITGDFELDGIGNGERFVSMHSSNARYCYKLDEWYIWDTIRWAVRPDVIESMAKLSARSIDDQPHRKRSSSKSGIDEILSMARSEPGMGIDFNTLDGDPMLFNCMNGTIDLKTGTLRKHDRRDMLTKISPASFDPKAKCPRWTLFLEQIFNHDADLIGYIQRMAGYAMTGLTSEHCLFFMHGLGQNGKSVLALTLLHVFGDYGHRAPAELIMKPDRSSSGSATPDLARLRGARLVVTSELEEQQRFGEARIKDLTGGDRIVARSLYKDPIEFDPTHKLLLYGNHKPTIAGTDKGIWRRMRLIPFEVTISENDRDPDLLETLRSERDGILAWMVEGCLAWQQEQLNIPSAVANATQDFRGESDHVGRFIDECCEQAAGVFVAKGDLFEAYQQWCIGECEEPFAKNTLSTRITQRGFTSKSTKTTRLWIGLELRKENEHG